MTIKQRIEWLIGITQTGIAWLITAAPSAIRFPRVNADNTVTYLTDAELRTALGTIGGTAGTTDNALIRADGTGGSTVQATTVLVDDDQNMSGVLTFSADTVILSSSLVAAGSLVGLDLNVSATATIGGTASIGGDAVVNGNVTAVGITSSGNLVAGAELTVNEDATFVQDVQINGVVQITGTPSFNSNISIKPVVGTGFLSVTGNEGLDAQLRLVADDGDDPLDTWIVSVNASVNNFVISDGDGSSAWIFGTGGATTFPGTINVPGFATFSAGAQIGLELHNGLGSAIMNTTDRTLVTSGAAVSLDWENLLLPANWSLKPTSGAAVFTITGNEATSASLILAADDGDDPADTWNIHCEPGIGNVLAFTNNGVTLLTLNTGTNAVAIGDFVVSGTGAVIWENDVRQTFNPGFANAGINVGATAVDISSPVNGDLWYDGTAHQLKARVNGATVVLA